MDPFRHGASQQPMDGRPHTEATHGVVVDGRLAHTEAALGVVVKRMQLMDPA